MRYTLLGLALATLLGITAYTGLGTESLLTASWVDWTFWGIIGIGLLFDHGTRLRRWFAAQPTPVQSLVVGTGLLLLTLAVSLLLGQGEWTWHIAG